MNKKGQVVMLYTVMIAIVVILFAIGIAPTLKVFSDSARAASSDTAVGLDCSNSSISDYDKASCTMLDINTPFILLALLSIAGIIIGAKVIFQ